MADPIRAALERLVAAERFIGEAGPEYQQAREAALAVLAAHPATTPSLAELVTPKPGYQPGTGREDGAQLVGSANGPEWWAPESGCDSLDITLDAIRSRIAPYLREPVAGEVLAAPTPPANGEVEEVEELIWRLGWIAAQCADIGWSDDSASVARAAALLREARPQPVPVAWLWEYIGSDPYTRRHSPVARSIHEMDPSNPPYPDTWAPIAPLYEAHWATPTLTKPTTTETPNG